MFTSPHWVWEVNNNIQHIASMFEKLCPSVNTVILIIFPLISLMEDQISSLKLECCVKLLVKQLADH